ncbi:MAG TPA: hypothetical protein VER55_09275, partial [Ardenticatenaceae bacterium]|nr:hypothetical protein [Ardenticatenaceae bacterium]
MTEIVVAVTDPAGERWPQLLDPNQPVGVLLPALLRRLNLPEGLRYELVSVAEQRTLNEGQTLRQAGVQPGAELQLRPVRDRFFDMLLDNLYQEAAQFVAAQLWAEAQQRLETLYRLNPAYPDRGALWPKVRGRVAASSGPVAPVGSVPTQPAAQPAAQPAQQGGSTGCLIVVILVVGAIVAWRVGLFSDLADRLRADRSSRESTFAQPGEPVLGTGDVQVTLRWDNPADLDLHVVDPAGEEISYGHPVAQSGGQLDVDANIGCQDDLRVENVFWPSGGAPTGTYQVEV